MSNQEKMDFWIYTKVADELAPLKKKDPFYLSLYMTLREHMDKETRLVEKSYAYLASCSEIQPDPGSHKKSERPSEKKIRHAIDMLVKYGLVERKSVNRDLIIFCKRAPTSKEINARNEQTKKRRKVASPGGGAEEGQISAAGGGAEEYSELDAENIGSNEIEYSRKGRVRGGPLLPRRGSLSSYQAKELNNYIINNSSNDGFDDFWKAYPNQVGKLKSREIWRKNKLQSQLEKILIDLPERKKTKRWRDGYIMGPERYLREQLWNDESVGLTVETDEERRQREIDEMLKRREQSNA